MEKTYKVVGDRIVHGAKKGARFIADLAEHEEHLLLVAGHVKVVTDKSAAPVGGTVTVTK